MSTASTPDDAACRAFQRWEVVPALLLAAGAALVLRPILADRHLLDLKLAFNAGVEAWQSGHPEAVETWMGTPLLALEMAVVSLLLPLDVAERILTGANVVLSAALLGVVWLRLRGRLSRGLWWTTLFAAAFFAPLISTIFYKQFGLILLALALVGFEAVRRGRPLLGGALVALSVATKPILLLLPLALLARRDTRRAGLCTVAWVAVFSLGALCVFALRAGDATLLDPFGSLGNFLERTRPWIVHPANVSPLGMLGRLVRPAVKTELEILRAAVVIGVVLLILGANEVVRDRPGGSWERFAFACLLSPLLGAIAWPHYGVLMLPMMLVLAQRFSAARAAWIWWGLLAAAYVLAELVVPPMGTLQGLVSQLLEGEGATRIEILRDQALSQFAPWFLFLAAFGWFNREQAASGAGRSS